MVRDASGAVLPGVTVTVTNVDTGDQRSGVTSDEGFYQALLLPLGSYKVVAELSGFKRVEGSRGAGEQRSRGTRRGTGPRGAG